MSLQNDAIAPQALDPKEAHNQGWATLTIVQPPKFSNTMWKRQ